MGCAGQAAPDPGQEPCSSAGCVPHAVDGAGCPFAFHQPMAINTVTFPTYCIYVSENVCVAYVMEQI